MIVWIKKIVFRIFLCVLEFAQKFLLPGFFYRLGTSGLIFTGNRLAVFYMWRFPAERYCGANFCISAFVYFR